MTCTLGAAVLSAVSKSGMITGGGIPASSCSGLGSGTRGCTGCSLSFPMDGHGSGNSSGTVGSKVVLPTCRPGLSSKKVALSQDTTAFVEGIKNRHAALLSHMPTKIPGVACGRCKSFGMYLSSKCTAAAQPNTRRSCKSGLPAS